MPTSDPDVRAALETLNAKRAELSSEGQAALDTLRDELADDSGASPGR